MNRSILYFFTGLTCGLFVATGSMRLSAPQSPGPSRITFQELQGVDAETAEHLLSGLDSAASMDLIADIIGSQDPAPVAEKPKETDRERLERKVRKLLKDNGTEAMQKRSTEAMLGQFEKMGLPPEFGTKFMARFDFDHVMDLAVKAYADHLDEPTVDALATFYATPSGRAFAEALPDITVELTEASMEYGQKIGMEVGEELSK